MMSSSKQHQIVIVGGGVAGLEIASTLGRRWRRRRGERSKVPSITLIDRDTAHVWKPMLHTIAAGTRDISQQQTTYIAQAHDAGFVYQPGELCGLDRAAHEVMLAPLHAPDGRLLVPARTLRYDTLIIAVGSRANDFGTPGVVEHCLMIDSRQQADAFNREVRIRMLQCLAQEEDLSIAIVGGGATGVELAAELVQLTETAVAYGAQGLSERITITLIESGPRLLAAFPQDISAATQARLEALGIRVLTQTRVSAADVDAFVLDDGKRIAASLKVWAAGVKAPDFLADLDGLEAGRGNQLLTRPSLQTTLDADIYAVGDCASLSLPGTQTPLPPRLRSPTSRLNISSATCPMRLRTTALFPTLSTEILARWCRWATTMPMARWVNSVCSKASRSVVGWRNSAMSCCTAATSPGSMDSGAAACSGSSTGSIPGCGRRFVWINTFAINGLMKCLDERIQVNHGEREMQRDSPLETTPHIRTGSI
ncbi:NADH dehydrogenase [Serratia plymuthica]|uniref:NAD(P)/FAD-dependent oxidoreductase n=1 Tax=Serratia plymuthica TaxID=82996 RepID=UPI00159B2011|nr:FAD-dependent oxidoreductase [Serratia plymuthica]QJW56458.1 NADH dehydrogenase [Serratia plymuthica]